LTFIGVKMLLPLLANGLIMITGDSSVNGLTEFLRKFLSHEYEQVLINISLGVVIGAILVSIVLSIMFPHRTAENAE
jgi:acid phosphatase family membrane protein YuiD